MAITRKKRTIFLLILAQTMFSIIAGFSLLFIFSYNHIPSGTYVGNVNVGDLTKAEAAKKINGSIRNIISNKSLQIKFNNKLYDIKYSDIDGALDSQASIDAAYGQGGQIIADIFAGTFSLKNRKVSPVITFNEGKLREKLNEFNLIVNRNTQDASIYVDGNKVVKIPETIGYKLNMRNAIEKVRQNLNTQMGSPIEFKVSNNYEISNLNPNVTIKEFNGVTDILAQYTTQITDMDNADSIKKAVSAINNTIIYSVHSGNGHGSVFSFNKCLQADNLIKSQNDEGYNQVASTLYTAVLIAGIDQNTITRSPHERTVDYIEPGLDVRVLGDAEDLNFQNTLTGSIVICAEMKGDKIKVSILGKKQNSFINSIKTEVEQRYAPTVINMENQDLKPGQKIMVSQGKEGLKVNVYRITTSGSHEIDKIMLYYDEYKPIDAVIQIGPNTNWHDNVGITK